MSLCNELLASCLLTFLLPGYWPFINTYFSTVY